MSIPKKQHYVPQLYLRKYSCSEKEPFHIYTLLKSYHKIIRANINDIAEESHFYSIDSLKDPYIWEKIYSSDIEPFMKRTLEEVYLKCESAVIVNHSTVLSQENKENLAIIMIFQIFRGKHTREYEKEIAKKITDDIIIYDRKNNFILSTISEERLFLALNDENNIKSAMMQVTFDIPKMKNYFAYLLTRYFTVYRITGESEFITSDNPIMFIDSVSLNATPFTNGLKRPTTIICFPLSPKLMLTAYHPDFCFGTLSKFDCSIEFLDCDSEKNYISTMNNKQIEQCYNQAYSRNRELLDNYNRL